MKCSEKIDLLSAALQRAQAAIPAVHRTGYNPHFESRFVPIEAVLDAALQGCHAHGITILQGCADVDHVGFMLETTALHISGQWITTAVWFPIPRDAHRDKETREVWYSDPTPVTQAGALTYSRRIGCCAFFAIAGEEDKDGNTDGEQDDAKPAPAKAAKKSAPPVNGEPGTGIPRSCPVCGGKVYDNRAKKASGEYKETAKDWTCADKECMTDGYRTGGWIADKPKKSAKAEGGPGMPEGAE